MSEGKGLAIIQRQNAALRLRKQGLSYSDIGQQLGISSRQAYIDVKAVLHDLELTRTEEADEMREIMIARIEGLIFTLSAEAEAGNLYAIDRIVRLQDQLAGLMGLKIERKDITTAGEKLPGFTAEDLSKLIDKARTELFSWKSDNMLASGDE